ncbi:MAG TPA: hypothetical protein VF168_01565 [Trueperaceae bacterium]
MPRTSRRIALPLLILVLAFASAQDGPFGNTWPSSEAAVLSSGCSSASTPQPPSSLLLDGRERPFITRIPASYRPGEPHDLVVAFHGRTNPNSQVQGYYDLDEGLPDALIVYPSALRFQSGFRWSDPGDPADALRDYELFDRLVSHFAAHYCLDLDRIFVVGHSLGASFANSLACFRGEVIRAVASVAGGIAATDCDGGTAALVMHHREDALVPISLGLRVVAAFVTANDLPPDPVPESRPELAALGCVRYGPDSANPVIWCEHDFATTRGGRYYPHDWPEAADEAIARFFGDLP